jgi:hypothetical protein
MRNVIISISLFVVMVACMFFSLQYLNRECTKLQANSDLLEETINKGDWQKSYNLSYELYSEWQNESKIMPIFANHAEIDMLNNEILKLTQYVKSKNKEESLASTHVIKFYLDNIQSIQKINIQNIL